MLSILKIPRTFHSHACSQSDPSNMRYLWQLMEDFLFTTGNAFFHPSLYKTKYSLSTSLQCQFQYFQFQPRLAKLSMWIWHEPHPTTKSCLNGHSNWQQVQSDHFFTSIKSHWWQADIHNEEHPNVHSKDPRRARGIQNHDSWTFVVNSFLYREKACLSWAESVLRGGTWLIHVWLE